ncbi:hypothetical protein [Microvirga subterranea]|uniref:hypothetical protein n=1 Tax=Microvirga subterranea TaxID=186651 RepID=UPI000E0B51DF|nr:hypothetical protein [Microvirga subterranea]
MVERELAGPCWNGTPIGRAAAHHSIDLGLDRIVERLILIEECCLAGIVGSGRIAGRPGKLGRDRTCREHDSHECAEQECDEPFRAHDSAPLDDTIDEAPLLRQKRARFT